MIKFFSKKLSNKKGFTLIELLIVIAVLGILAALAAPRFLGVADKFKRDTDEESAKILAREVELLLQTEVIDPSDYTTIKKVDAAAMGDANYKFPVAQVKGHGENATLTPSVETDTSNDTAVILIAYSDGTPTASSAVGADGVVFKKEIFLVK